MQRLAQPRVTPPGGFRYIDPDTQFRSEGVTREILIKTARNHRTANGLEIPDDFDAILEDWLCRQMPAGICLSENGHKIRHGAAVQTAENSVRATMLITRLARRLGRAPVSQDVATKRALICSACPRNTPFAGCMSCRGVKSIIDNLTRGRQTELDGSLQSCNVCGIVNTVHIWVDAKTAVETMGRLSSYPEHCWKFQLVKGAANEEHEYQDGDRGTDPRGRSGAGSRSRRAGSQWPDMDEQSVRPRSKPRRRCCGSR